MNPTSRFTGCIAAEQRRLEVLTLVATQQEIARHREQPQRTGSRIMHAAARMCLLVRHFGRPYLAADPSMQESRVGW